MCYGRCINICRKISFRLLRMCIKTYIESWQVYVSSLPVRLDVSLQLIAQYTHLVAAQSDPTRSIIDLPTYLYN